MIIASQPQDKFKQEIIKENNKSFLKECMWIDLINPTLEEEATIEEYLGLDIPTREEMEEIELSSRLYIEDDNVFMTATMIAHSDSLSPKQEPVTFVLTPNHLVTIRYIEPQAFKLFTNRIHKLAHCNNPISLLTELLDVTVDRLADILEIISHQLEDFSKNIFQTKSTPNFSYQELLQKLGINGDLNSKIVESLVSFNRLIPFFDQSAIKDHTKDRMRLMALAKDINALTDHANFLSHKISFLLEATLGMVQIEQNAIIKIFSVAAVIFLPPTLVASIYGMNFQFMPELHWHYGYVVAISIMLMSSWLPYRYFKYRKWL